MLLPASEATQWGNLQEQSTILAASLKSEAQLWHFSIPVATRAIADLWWNLFNSVM